MSSVAFIWAHLKGGLQGPQEACRELGPQAHSCYSSSSERGEGQLLSLRPSGIWGGS